jgi:serine/threonine protein kinase
MPDPPSFDRYTIEQPLGEGGMGVVYRARDDRLGRRVALKVLRLDAGATPEARTLASARLVREARAAAALDHPNAVSIFDVGEHDGAPFIAMELVAGRSLRAAMGDASVTTQEKLQWLADVARALDAAHRAGIVHRDVKPENVMVRTDGIVKVLDFGIARRSATAVDPTASTQASALHTVTAHGTLIGTPEYMAPEQIKGDPIDGQADQFSWGVLSYELLSGKLPWRARADPLAVAASILTDDPAPLRRVAPDVSPEVEAIVMRALEKRRGDRFASMHDVMLALEPSGRGSSIPPAATPARPTADLRKYSTAEVRAIFDRAIEREEKEPTGLDRNELVEVARELGVDEAAVTEAARELDARKLDEKEPEVPRSRAFPRLMRSVAVYVIVNVFLILMFGWHIAKWPIMGWGLAVALQTMSAVFPKQPREDSDRRRRRRQRRGEAAVDRAIEDGATTLLTAGRERARLRVAASTRPAGRLRVDPASGAPSETEPGRSDSSDERPPAARRR